MSRAFVYAIAAILITGAASAATVSNGDFESTTSAVGEVNHQRLDSLNTPPGANWDVYDEIPGWITLDGAGIEIQTDATLGHIDAHSGDHYVELDSHPGPRSNSTMGQNLGMLSAGVYELSFFYSPRTANLASMGVEFGAFGGASLLDTISTGTVGAWSQIVRFFHVTDATKDTTIYFKAVGYEDTYGGLIDTVAVAPIPAPAAALLLGTALVALGLARWRRPAA